MKKLKPGVKKIRKAIKSTTDSLHGTTSKTDSANAQVYVPAPAVQIAALPHGDSNISPATANSPFFNKLPIEVRLRILNALFGGRTVHIGFDEHSVVPYPQSQAKTGFSKDEHCAWRSRRTTGGREAWYGCLCHRLPGDDFFGSRLVHDTCLEGRSSCWDWAGKIPYKCWLGAVG